MCSHRPPVPARPTTGTATPPAPSPVHPEQGWSLLCNGVIMFDDTGEILPGGQVIPPHCPARVRLPVAA